MPTLAELRVPDLDTLLECAERGAGLVHLRPAGLDDARHDTPLFVVVSGDAGYVADR